MKPSIERGAVQILAGVLSACVGVGLASAGASAALTQAAPTPKDTPAAATARATPNPAAPPRVLGPRYDHDGSLPSKADPVASYTLSARLDAKAHVVTGSGTIHWVNRSRRAVNELYLHLYLNAFKNERTLFLRSPYGAGRSGEKATRWGYIDVEKLVARELDGRDLWPAAAPHSPGLPDDATDIRVPLPKPIEPGERLTLDVAWTAQLPEIVERTGYSGSYHFVAQWFPKLARLEPDGSWAHFAFHPQSEFYADYGDYRVTLDVPSELQVGASGKLVSESIADGRRVVTHELDSAHDFAWTAWNGFAERTENIAGVSVRLLYPRGYRQAAEDTLRALRFAIPHLSRLYGRYPYPTLTVVHPPDYAQKSGGMEYPTLITTGGPWYIGKLGIHVVETVTVHELGHQWFYGLVGTNEHAWPFLDEGLCTYAECVAMERGWGDGSLVDFLGLKLGASELRRSFAASHAKDDLVALPASDFASFNQLSALVYGRTGTALDTIGNVYGQDALLRAIGRYTRRYRYQHPGPRHFLAAIREVLGDEAAEALRIALFERGWVDYRTDSLKSTAQTEPAGIFERDGGRETVARPSASAEGDTTYVGRVLVFRHGTLRFPVDVDLVLGDGSRIRKHWDGRGRWTAIPYSGKSPLVGAVVDPEQRITLDDNLLNNATSSRPGGAPRITERAVYAAELLLGALGP